MAGWVLAVWALAPDRAKGAWTDTIQGYPVLLNFTLRDLGAQEAARQLAQDGQGRLLVGSDGLLVYDGVTWNRFSYQSGYQLVNALAVASNGRVVTGGANELGYFTEGADGRFEYRSLVAEIPAEDRDFKIVWQCAEINGALYYVCQSKILCWDGQRMKVWNFPTKRRLFPVRLGEELWFTHQETGLYRIAPEGPHLEHGAEALPARAPFWLERDKEGLRVASSNGFFRIGRPGELLCSPAVAEFLERAALTSVVKLPGGEYLLGTLGGGIGVMSADGRLLRVIDQAHGLPTNAINNLLRDRSGQVWAAVLGQGVFRFDASGAISHFSKWGDTARNEITALADVAGQLYAGTDKGIFRLGRTERNDWEFSAVSPVAERYESLAPLGEDLLASRYANLELISPSGHARVVLRELSTTFSNLTPSRVHAGRIYATLSGSIAAIESDGDGHWAARTLLSPAQLAGELAEDSTGRLWLQTAQDGIYRYEPDGGKFAQILKPAFAGPDMSYSLLEAWRDRVYVAIGPDIFATLSGEDAPQPLISLPVQRIDRFRVAANGRMLYIAFTRRTPAGGLLHGLGAVSLDIHGRGTGWKEYSVPGFTVIGTPRTLLVRQEDTKETIWVGGAEGLLRIKPAELAVSSPPQPPRLRLVSNGAAPADADRLAFPFFGHRLTILAHTPEINRRRELWFQSRVANRDANWSPPNSAGTFEFTNLTDDDYLLEVRIIDAAGRTSESAHYTFRILPPWYRTNWAYAGYALASGLAVFGFIRVRERRHRRRAAELERTVAERTAELVKANAAKDEFLAGVSHEIRNPMNGVIGLAATLDPSRLDAINRKRLDQLRYCATHLSGLLEDILDFSRLQAGAVTLNPQTFDLPELIHSIGAITAVESAQAGIPVELAVSPAVPRFLVGDPARIRQILLNFVINALKYSGRGTVCVTVWSRQVKPEECEVTFAVSDDGPGIAPEELKRLFTRFERGAAARERRVGGTGLGLSVSKNLAEKMGGRIDVESELGHGSTFSFIVTLPIDTAARPAEAPARPRVPAANTTPFRALVVDDEEYNRIAMAALLEEVGFATDFAADGVAALEVAARTRFDAIFLDVDLPKKSGLEVARELRARPDLPPDLPIVATTAFGTPEKRAQCVAAGMNGFLGKPVSIEKIRSALAAATAAQRAAAPVHPPGELTRGDPLASLRLLAQRKNVPLAREIGLYLDELATEARALESHLASRDQAEAGRSAHRLTGRFAFIRASAEEQLAREIEAAAVNELWDQAEAAWRRLAALLPELRARLISTS